MEYKHFSHPHALKLEQIQNHEGSAGFVCSGCESAIAGPAYTCSSQGCSFSLHQQCGNAARGMQHPSHALHHLTLVPYTTYSAGTFLCNACGSHGGKGFSYCCPLCDFDLHGRCALLPQVTAHHSHPLHNLVLVFNSVPAMAFTQFGLGNQLVCNLCNQLMDSRLWSYNCYACNFHIHASCALNGPPKLETGTEGSGSVVAYETSKKSEMTQEPRSSPGEDASETTDIEAKTEPGTESGAAQIQPGTTSQAEDLALRRRLELEQLKLQMQMSSALANMMGSFNLSSFV
ncbi:PREDICTED: uncharacterized protein LOC104802616 [Tarenaya hassleriana]|uniref:uncharacterized protein LOC104802616 n=1 Tax=Tarenaya hassleriana TaxID=28532 RepID=UPI00053C7B94|nr:PREDICTED: uncharacterized protein LOC104802616 [Tarenaya hassleriana]